MKYFTFQSYDAEFPDRCTISLHGLKHNRCDAEGNDDLFSEQSDTLVKGRRLFSPGNAARHNRAPFNGSVCIKVCEAKQRRLARQKGEGWLLAFIYLKVSEGDGLVHS